MIIIKKGVLFVLILILLSYGVFGTLDIALKKADYGPNQHLEGNFSFSFSGELVADTPVIVAINGIIFERELKDFLGVSATDASYSKIRVPVSIAEIVFDAAGSNTSYGIDLTQGGNIVPEEINKIIFNIEGSAIDNTYPMSPSIKLGDQLVWSYRGGIIEPKTYINPGIPYLHSFKKDGSDSLMPQEAFCEKTIVKAAPKYKIITDVKKVAGGYKLLAFIIDDIESETIPNSCGTDNLCCELTDVGTDFEKRNCIIEKGIDFDSERYLCITTGPGSGTGIQYKIGKEVRDDIFGGYYVDDYGDVYPQTNTDYFIWYEFAKFKTNLSEKVVLNDFKTLIEDDYPSKGDIIPITIRTWGKGRIKLLDLLNEVERMNGPVSEYDKFTPIKYTPAKVTYSGTKTQDLSAGFLSDLLTPVEEGTYSLTVTIGGETKSKTINVVSEPFAWIEWEPEFPGVKQETMFNGSESESPNGLDIVGYKWDFGDDTTGNGSIVKHKYNETGDYNVRLTVTDSNGISGIDEVTITVRSIIGDLGIALNATELRINSMKNYIENAEEYIKDSAELLGINTILDNATTELSLLKIGYDGAKALPDTEKEAKLGQISSNLYNLMDNIPGVFGVDSFEFTVRLANLDDIPDPSQLGIQVSDSESFKQGILNYQEGITVYGEARLVYIAYLSEKEESFILVKKIIDGQGLKGKIYESSSDIDRVLTDGYEAVVPNSIYRWPVDKREIVYTINSEDVGIGVESRTFVVPPLNELGKIGGDLLEYGFDCGNGVCDFGEDRISCPQDCKQKYPVGFIIFLVVLTVIGVWYINFYHGKFSFKRFKYDIKSVGKEKEEGLFKSEKDVINLTNYINNSLEKGMSEKQIIYVLMQKGWKDIQIKEAFKQAKKR